MFCMSAEARASERAEDLYKHLALNKYIYGLFQDTSVFHAWIKQMFLQVKTVIYLKQILYALLQN